MTKLIVSLLIGGVILAFALTDTFPEITTFKHLAKAFGVVLLFWLALIIFTAYIT